MEALIVVLIVLGVVLTTLAEYLTAALLDLRQTVFTVMAEEGSATGARFRSAFDSIEEVSLAISLVNVIGVLGAGAGLAMHSEGNWLGLTTEMAIVVISMVVLKATASMVGSRYAEHFLRGTSVMLTTIRTLAYPALLIHRVLMRLTHRDNSEEEAREELEAFVETAREEGALDPGEYRIMTNIMRLSSVSVGDVMTPRLVVFSLPVETTIADALKMPELQMYSRFPVYEENDLDSVSGYVITKDVLRAALAGRQSIELTKLKRPIKFIPENVTLERALEQFLQERYHMFMVVDEHGGVEGLLTMEDVLETMLGVEIVDEADRVVDLRQLAKQQRDARIARIEQQRAEQRT